MSSATLRDYFPIFSQAQNKNWVYFDTAATSQKLKTVIDITQGYYQERAVNVHRSSHQVAASVTADFEAARIKVQRFIGAKCQNEIVWTKGATESINLVASGLAQSQFNAGDEIVISALEHHANIVPWQQLAQKLQLQLKVMPVDKSGVLQLPEALAQISKKTALVAVGHVSNALGNINPIAAIIEKAKSCGALTLIDGTQAVSHLAVDVQQLDCDFYVFSGHKMFGPTGIGVLYGKFALLEQLPPYQLGGEMIKKVSFSQTTFQPPPLKFEAGTPNIAGVLALSAAVDFIQQHRRSIQKVELELYQQLYIALQAIPEITLWGEKQNSISVQSFTIKNVNQYDLAVLLDKCHVAIRVGHHCAMPLMETLGIEGTVRVSIGPYNTIQEIQLLVAALTASIAALKAPDKTQEVSVDKAAAVSAEPHSLPLASSIKQAKSWDQTYRLLMLAGKELVRLENQHKTPDTEVQGCESQVWVSCEFDSNQLMLSGDSPSKIVRGLLAVLFEILATKTPQQVLNFDLAAYLEQLSLGRHLSQSRGNGLTAVVNKITQSCADYCKN